MDWKLLFNFSFADLENLTVTSPQLKIYGIFLTDIRQRPQWRVFNSSSAVPKSSSGSTGADLVGEQLTKYVWFSFKLSQSDEYEYGSDTVDIHVERTDLALLWYSLLSQKYLYI